MMKLLIVAAALASGVCAQQGGEASTDACYWENGACEAPFCINGAAAMAVSCLSADPQNGCPEGCEVKQVEGIPQAEAGGVSRVCAMRGGGAKPMPYQTALRLREACGDNPNADNLQLNPGGACTQASLAMLVETGCTSSACQDDYINQAQRADTCSKQTTEALCVAVNMPCPDAGAVAPGLSGARGAAAATAAVAAVAMAAAAFL